MSPAVSDDGGLQSSEALQRSHRAFSAIILYEADRGVQQTIAKITIVSETSPMNPETNAAAIEPGS